MSVQHGHSQPQRGGREGGEDGPRRAEGRGEEREERRREQMSVVRGSCGPWSLTKMSVFHYFTIFGCRRKLCFGLVEGVFTGMQQSTVKLERCLYTVST